MIQRFGRVNRRGNKDICNCDDINLFVCNVGSENDKYIYSRSTVEKTINKLSNIDILYESKIQQLIDNIYSDGYSEKEEKEYNSILNMFESYLRDLHPFIDNPESKQEFEGLFKSFEVVPSCFQNEYLECIEQRKYYDAMSYITQIYYRQFFSLKKDNLISQNGNNSHIVHTKYDETLGLLIENEDSPYKEL